MINEEIIAIFILGIFFGIALTCLLIAASTNYFKVKRYFKISFKEYIMLDDSTKNGLANSANNKLHTEILERTERKEQQNA